jgi:Holliday junction resolvase RusA-like endonuclease
MLPFEFVIAGPPMSARSHYLDKLARLDADNMVKPILDAMTGVVYHDDRQASHIEVRSVNLDLGYTGRNVGKLLATKLMAGGEFLHIRVEQER